MINPVSMISDIAVKINFIKYLTVFIGVVGIIVSTGFTELCLLSLSSNSSFTAVIIIPDGHSDRQL